MNELIYDEVLSADSKLASNAEFYLATITGGSKDVGLKIRLDGDSSGSTKSYKLLMTGREPPKSGDRVLVIKLSGTYVVLGKIGMPSSWWTQSELSSGSTQSQIINKVNSLIRMLIDVGICRSGS